MQWWQAVILGLVQGLTEFLPVSSSGHLMIFKSLLGVDSEGFLDFTVMVHLATVISTIIVFWAAIKQLFVGLFRFRYNDETDYVCKILVSLIPVAIVGLFFKDKVETMFGDSLVVVGIFLVITAILLYLSDFFTSRRSGRPVVENGHRNGISYLQAFIVGIAQAVAVAPGLSRSGTTIATGLMTGVKREAMAQFSFLMVLIPVIGEQLLSAVETVHETGHFFSGAVSPACLTLGFAAAFLSGLFACKVMITIVKKAKLTWFALYCAIVALLIFIFA
jgi:undecaprenyl-diphosphatase